MIRTRTSPRLAASAAIVFAAFAAAAATGCTGSDALWSHRVELRQRPDEPGPTLGTVTTSDPEGWDLTAEWDAGDDAWGPGDVTAPDAVPADDDLGGGPEADPDGEGPVGASDVVAPLGVPDVSPGDPGLRATISWEAWQEEAWSDDGWAGDPGDPPDTSGSMPGEVDAATGDDAAPVGPEDATAGDDAGLAEDTTVEEDTSLPEQDTVVPAPAGMVVEWCRMMHPAAVVLAPGEQVEVAGHVNVPGQTDKTLRAPDPAPWLIGEVGFGPRGSRPDHDPSAWIWARAHVDEDPPSWVFHKHDRYLAPLAIPEPGLWDYGFRFSADGGASWKYCDLDGSFDGYELSEAGAAEVID